MTTQDTMQQAHDALEETRNALAWFYDSYPADVTPKGNKLLPHVETVLTALREALEQQVETVGEVVDIDIDEDGQPFAWVALYNDVGIGEKLYAGAAPAPQAQHHIPDAGKMVEAQQPLTDEQIKLGVETLGGDLWNVVGAYFRQGVRFAEHAHGIGEKQ